MAMRSFIQRYQRQVAENPMRTFGLQAALMFSIGDVLAQQVVEEKGFRNHDPVRTLRMGVYGCFVAGPVTGKWHQFLNRTVTIKNRAGSIATRLAIDQLFFGPTLLFLFMSGISILEGQTLAGIRSKFENNYVDTMKRSYQFWPFFNLISFTFFPYQYRPLASSGASVVWNAYLSFVNQKACQVAANTPVVHVMAERIP
ncbi:hypothetical protein J3Q64DRAFT_1789374 [Phycomyces blakesleeanus]|uniref:Uncharacterized protein n=2 Tax=Phycomyces blakesleeanus TaxID=4837 RepID=A0A162Z8X5_PHYB8|nr:hypothetical protein PHYBLDRAFT_80622 [Phycomyces blakesleeanus NRRL 1555(-)]OAD65101.1 hypothetical protein PHYBLDRAFT_80622 [Phycomyces blakesleeanus NRRL 1555(-)]|eukprot:XP_018283141.1 hypothetical protein PHYBLDRAFT_80622 [Phycomyces blakesleeanus NRRL 1555(-)]